MSAITRTDQSFVLRFEEFKNNTINDSILGSNPILKRIVHLLSVPAYAITAALDAIIATGVAIGFMMTAGFCCGNKMTSHQLGSTQIIASPYASVLRALNPEAEIDEKIRPLGADFTADLWGQVHDLTESHSWLNRHMVSRLTVLVAIVASLVCEAVNAIIGIVAAPFSLLTLGVFKSLNTRVDIGLTFPGTLPVAFMYITAFLNPFIVPNV